MGGIPFRKNWLLYAVGFLYFAVSNLSRMFELAGVPREAMYVLFLAFLAFYFAKNLRSIGWLDLAYYAVVAPLTLRGLLNYATYIQSRASVLSVLILYLPAYLFFRLFARHEDILSKCVTAAGWYAALYLLPYYVFFVRGQLSYSMQYAYWVSFPVCMLVYRFFETKRWGGLVLAAVLYATLVLSGCRGALLLTTLFCLFASLDAARRYHWRWTSGRMLCLLGGIAVLVVLAASLDSILAFLEKFSGVSRNIRKLFEGNYLESSARTSIYQVCQELISARPGGYGPLASRRLLLGFNYPHSLWYELQLDYGPLCGILLFCGLVVISVCNVLAYRNTKLSFMVSYLAIVGLGSMMFSSSYYYEMHVPAMCGLFVLRQTDARRLRPRGAAVPIAGPPPAATGRNLTHAR
jgi:hypothetical protein